MPHYHDSAELAPRDVVARAIIMEMHKTRGEFVYLDLTALDPDHVQKRFPRIFSTCLQYNIDITTDLVPIRPAAHYSMGGVATDLSGATSLPGLFAAGEVACYWRPWCQPAGQQFPFGRFGIRCAIRCRDVEPSRPRTIPGAQTQLAR